MKYFSRKPVTWIASLFFVTVLLGIAVYANALAPGTFVSTGSMTAHRAAHTATRLHGGKVLVAGGYGSQGGDIPLASAELYDPSTGTFSTTGSMTAARIQHTATLLPDGKVLITGGWNGGSALASAELYDPTTGTFSATGSMNAARIIHTATLLHDGKVLIAGGNNYGSTTFASAELYDPTTGSFSATGSMTATRIYHTATLLKHGQVLVTGGFDAAVLASAELYDPSAGTFSSTGNMSATRIVHTATLLLGCKVLIAGGEPGGAYVPTLASAELHVPAMPCDDDGQEGPND